MTGLRKNFFGKSLTTDEICSKMNAGCETGINEKLINNKKERKKEHRRRAMPTVFGEVNNRIATITLPSKFIVAYKKHFVKNFEKSFSINKMKSPRS